MWVCEKTGLGRVDFSSVFDEVGGGYWLWLQVGEGGKVIKQQTNVSRSVDRPMSFTIIVLTAFRLPLPHTVIQLKPNSIYTFRLNTVSALRLETDTSHAVNTVTYNYVSSKRNCISNEKKITTMIIWTHLLALLNIMTKKIRVFS